MSIEGSNKITLVPLRNIERLDVDKTKAEVERERKSRILEKRLKPFTNTLKKSNNFELSRQETNEDIYDVFRSHIEKIYESGSDYTNAVNNSLSRLTKTDIDNINRIADKATNSYYRLIERYRNRENEKELNNEVQNLYTSINAEFGFQTNLGHISQIPHFNRKSLNIDAHVTGLIETISIQALNIAIVSKGRQLSGIGSSGFDEDKVVNTLAFDDIGKNFNEFPLPEHRLEESRLRLMWVAVQDERLCPICRPLHGTFYYIDEPYIPMPPMFSHPRCRCRMMYFDSTREIILVDVLVFGN